jgi:hypothetical protein
LSEGAPLATPSVDEKAATGLLTPKDPRTATRFFNYTYFKQINAKEVGAHLISTVVRS